jgi:hypothetical protein
MCTQKEEGKKSIIDECEDGGKDENLVLEQAVYQIIDHH